MTRIETVAQLRRFWSRIATALSRDLSAMAGLEADPVATLRRHGFDLSPNAAYALRLALP